MTAAATPTTPPSEGVAVGLDIGGTKIAAGLVAADGSVLAYLRRDTPDDAGAIPDLCAATARQLWEPHGLQPVPVGVGAAGMVDLDGVVRYAPNIGWRDFPLGKRLGDLLDTPVTVENDANVAAWGEYRVGGGRHARHSMIMLTIGTGVGGGLIVDNHLVRGAEGIGAEFGHMVVSEGGPPCNCGNHGDLESLASGTAIGRTARQAVDAGEVPDGSSLLRNGELVAGGLPGAALTGKTVTVAAHAGDQTARTILARAGFWLGVGIASLINALDPELVLLGGGAMQAGELLLEPAREAAYERVMGREHRTLPPIVGAQLGDQAGFVGAALLALEKPPAWLD